MANLEVDVFGLKFKNPLVLSSGCLTHTGNGMIRGLRGGASCAIGKTCGKVGKHGHPNPQIFFVPDRTYMINAQGIPNPGIDAFEKEIEKAVASGLGHVFGSALGAVPEDFVLVAQKLEAAGAELVELNVSCVHPTHGLNYGYLSGDKPEQVYETVKAVKSAVKIPVVPKLSSTKILDVPEFAIAAEEAGADGVTLVNTLPAVDLNAGTLKPVVGNPDGVAGLSGDAVLPIVLRCIADTARVIHIPIMATGGCSNGVAAAKMIALGASLIQVHTAAMYEGMDVFGKIAGELDKYLDQHKIGSVAELKGSSLQYFPEQPIQFRAQ